MSLTGNASANEVLRGRINRCNEIIINAYHIAVKNGFEGTEEEWLASLKGEKGDKGDPGAVQTVNGVAPDENGNVEITIPDSSQNVNPAEKTEDMTQSVGVDENGQLWTAPTTSSGSGGGISTTAITLLTDILKAAMFTTNVSGKIESLQEALLAGSSGDSGGGSGGGSTVADEITFENGMLTIITVGSDVSVADGIMTIL